MTTTTFGPALATTTAFACVRHGMCDGFTCEQCGAQCYDLNDPRERHEMTDLRVLAMSKRRSWVFVGMVVVGILPCVALHLFFPQFGMGSSLPLMLLGAGLGKVAKSINPPALARLDEVLRTERA